MKRRLKYRRSGATTPQARIITTAIRQGERRGEIQAQIAARLGLSGPRAVRKIKSGETPATRIFAAKMRPMRPGSSPNIMRADIDLGDGMIRTVNVKIPNVVSASGGTRAPTPFDVYRFPDLTSVAEAEGRAMQRRYDMQGANAPRFVGLRRIERRGAAKLITIRMDHR